MMRIARLSSPIFALLLTQCVVALACITSQVWSAGLKNAGSVVVSQAVLRCDDAWLTVSDEGKLCPEASRAIAQRAIDLIQRRQALLSRDDQWRHLGLATWVTGDGVEAIELFEHALRADSQPELSQLYLGLGLLTQGSRYAAIEHLREAKAAAFFITRARSRALEGNAVGATTDLTVATEINHASIAENNDTYSDAWIRVGNLFRKEGDFDKAERAYLSAVKASSPGLATRAYRELAVLLFQSGRVSDAARVLETATKVAPDNIDLQILLSDIYANLGRDEEAITLLHQSTSLAFDPELQARAYDALGRLNASRGLWPDAIEAYGEAVLRAPDAVDYRKRLAETYELVGQADLALQEYTVLLSILPDDQSIRQAIERLKSRLYVP